MPGFESTFPDRPARRLVTIRTEISLCNLMFFLTVHHSIDFFKLPTQCKIPLFFNNMYVTLRSSICFEQHLPCSSSGGQIVLLQPLVSSLSVNSRAVCRWRADCSPLSTGILYGCLQRVTIPEAVVIQFVLLRMSKEGAARNMLRI